MLLDACHGQLKVKPVGLPGGSKSGDTDVCASPPFEVKGKAKLLLPRGEATSSLFLTGEGKIIETWKKVHLEKNLEGGSLCWGTCTRRLPKVAGPSYALEYHQGFLKL